MYIRGNEKISRSRKKKSQRKWRKENGINRLGRPISEKAKRKIITARVDAKEYDDYVLLAQERCTNVSGLIRRLLHEEKTGRSRVGYCTLRQRDFVEAIKEMDEDNLEDLLAYSILFKMSLAALLTEFDRALDAEEITVENGHIKHLKDYEENNEEKEEEQE